MSLDDRAELHGQFPSEAQLRFYFEASPLLMGAVALLDDGDLHHLYDNEASNRFFGLPPGGTEGRTARAMGVPETTISLWRQHYEEAAKRGRSVSFDYLHEPWPGGARVLAVTVAPLPGSGSRQFSYVAEDVTERRLTEENLKRQESRLEIALEAARLGDWSWDSATNLVTLSPRAAAIFGVPSGTHMTWEDVAALMPEEDQLAARNAAAAAMAGDTYEVEYRIRRPSDGEIVWVGVRGSALFNDVGEPVARIGMAWDQTRLKSAETQLREALESTTDSIFVLSPEWNFTLLNQRAVGQIARGRDLIGKNIWKEFPEAVGGPLYAAYQRCMLERVQTVADQFYEPLDRHFKARAFPTATGGITVFFRDVTDELASADRLARVEGTLFALGEVSPDLLYAKDRAGRMIYCNPATLSVIGRPSEDVLGKTDAEWMPNVSEGEALTRNDQAIMANGVSQTVEEQVTDARLGEVRIWQSTKTPLRHPRTGEVTGIVGVSRDITDQRRSEAVLEAKVDAAIAAREAANERLVQAEKLTALGQLAGGIAHDVNNVMQAVLGGSMLIQSRASDPESVTRIAKMIGEAANRGGSLTRKLLAFARRGELKSERIDPARLLESLREVLAHTLGSEIALELRLETDLPSLLADRGQLETALINLATNARDAMPSGGTLILSAARVRIGEDHKPPLGKGDYICFGVADSGAGIAADVLPRVLEPFFTTKPQDKGTGLGLPLAQSFAEQSGGSLEIHSSIGSGTRVEIYLPVTAGRGIDNAEAQSPTRMQVSARVLVVEDEYLVREVVAEQLRDAGLTVTEAADGPTALALVRAGEAFDVLITDKSMPGIDGVTLIREVRTLRPDVPALLLTGYAGEAGDLGSGEFAVLRKPVNGETLLQEIADLLAK